MTEEEYLRLGKLQNVYNLLLNVQSCLANAVRGEDADLLTAYRDLGEAHDLLASIATVEES